jgi:TonB family protein
MHNNVSDKTSIWRQPLAAIAASLAINAAVIFTLTFAVSRLQSDDVDLSVPVEIFLTTSERQLLDENEKPLHEPEPFAGAYVVQNNLPENLFSELQPDAKKPNGLLDTEDGGTSFKPEKIRSGGGGGSGADAIALGHVASDDRVWARMKWKPDPNAKVAVAGGEEGRGLTVPGTLKSAGAGVGLGNGTGSGALGSQGNGSGSGAGTNGVGSGTGLGTAAPPPVSRKPGVISMTRGAYPAEARAARHEGTVTLSVEVLPSGDVGKVAVQVSSGYDELDRAAIAAAKEWRFTGALKDGKPVSFWYAIPYRFVLTEY